MLGFQPIHWNGAVGDLDRDGDTVKQGDCSITHDPTEANITALSEGLHRRLLHRYNKQSMHLRVANKDRVACCCFDNNPLDCLWSAFMSRMQTSASGTFKL